MKISNLESRGKNISKGPQGRLVGAFSLQGPTGCLNRAYFLGVVLWDETCLALVG